MREDAHRVFIRMALWPYDGFDYVRKKENQVRIALHKRLFKNGGQAGPIRLEGSRPAAFPVSETESFREVRGPISAISRYHSHDVRRLCLKLLLSSRSEL